MFMHIELFLGIFMAVYNKWISSAHLLITPLFMEML